MPILTVRDNVRSVIHHIERAVPLEDLCPSPPPRPYVDGWRIRPEGHSLVLVSPAGAPHSRLGPGDALELGGVTLALESDGTPGGSTERLAPERSARLLLALPCGRRVVLGSRVLTIGKHPRCDVVLADPAVSALHCRIVPAHGRWEIRDAGSTNGTRIDDVRVEAAVLAPGIALTLGRTRVLCVRDPIDAARRTPDPSASSVITLVGDSPGMVAVRQAIRRYGPRRYPVLILGETGSGKELVARMLHEQSTRARGPFVAINAATIAPELVESELFGHEKGAFSGAIGRRRGVFEEASGGTLFLDELGELPLAQQAKLLRVLETGEVRRVGGEGAVRVDVRIVCATHRDLATRASQGLFRADLLYRLDVLRVVLPPLRHRREDLPALARHLMARVGAELGEPRALDDAALTALVTHDWPGNVRELYAALSRAAVESGGERVGVEHLALASAEQPPSRESVPSEVPPAPPAEESASSGRGSQPPRPSQPPRTLEPTVLRALLDEFEGNMSRTAAALGIARSTLRDRLRRSESSAGDDEGTAAEDPARAAEDDAARATAARASIAPPAPDATTGPHDEAPALTARWRIP